MATFDASIKRVRSSQEDLKRHREHCSADPQRLAAIGRAVRHQVRITRTRDEYGLYTVSEAHPENPDDVVRMGPAGRRRLGTSGEFAAVVESRGPHPTISEDRAEAEGEFIERFRDHGRQSGLIAIAPHGGDIELNTDRQAERVRSRLGVGAASAWRCKGWNGDRGAFERWHITSTDINEASFPRLERATRGSRIEVRIARPNEGFGGGDPCNVVNRLSAGGGNGIQIEQCPQAREDDWRRIADAVAEVYRPKL